MGHLVAVDAADGRLLWQKDFVADFGTEVPAWGMVGASLVDGDRLVCLVGGQAGAKVVAFDKRTGSEIWRALPSDGEPGYNQPVVFDIGGTRQLIIWHPKAISSLDPATGEIHWEQPFKVTLGMTVSTPVRSGPLLFVSAFFDGGRMLRLTEDPPGAELLWASSGGSDVETDKIHTLINTAVFQGDYLYGIDSYGQARCLEALTGRRLWESLDVTKEKARWAAALIVRNGDRYFINNDRGELIIARFSPQGYQEVSRTQLIEPTSPSTRRRELGAVHWSHPAYANRHIVVRNDREILRASLAKRPD